MRIIHDIKGEVQVGCSGEHYSYRVDLPEPPPYRGGRVDVTIVSKDPWGGPDEVVRIHGDLDRVREALERALDQVRGLAEVMPTCYAEDVAKNWQALHDTYVRYHPQ